MTDGETRDPSQQADIFRLADRITKTRVFEDAVREIHTEASPVTEAKIEEALSKRLSFYRWMLVAFFAGLSLLGALTYLNKKDVAKYVRESLLGIDEETIAGYALAITHISADRLRLPGLDTGRRSW
jgi:hypothetical protein